MKVGPNVAWRLVSGNLLTVTSILGLRALLWRLLTKASLEASLSRGCLLRVKEARDSRGDQMRSTGLTGGPTQTARASTHRPAFTFVPPSYATVRAHGMGGGGARQVASVPSWEAPRGPGCTHGALAGSGESALPAVPLTRLPRAPGCPPGALEARV